MEPLSQAERAKLVQFIFKVYQEHYRVPTYASDAKQEAYDWISNDLCALVGDCFLTLSANGDREGMDAWAFLSKATLENDRVTRDAIERVFMRLHSKDLMAFVGRMFLTNIIEEPAMTYTCC